MATQNNAVRQQAIISARPPAIASDSSIEGALGLTTTNMTIPRFDKNQRVWFVGGVGTIRYCRVESGTWTYGVEMEMGPEPDMGRIGSETTILLHEADIHEVM
jgi:hypothetical protein